MSLYESSKLCKVYTLFKCQHFTNHHQMSSKQFIHVVRCMNTNNHKMPSKLTLICVQICVVCNLLYCFVYSHAVYCHLQKVPLLLSLSHFVLQKLYLHVFFTYNFYTRSANLLLCENSLCSFTMLQAHIWFPNNVK